jgi:CubicO group peptidase (beta-lactamase class C family)
LKNIQNPSDDLNFSNLVQMKSLVRLNLLLLLFSCSSEVDYSSVQWLAWDKDTVSYFPEQYWEKYKIPEEAGWSIEKLKKAKLFWEQSQSSALLVIYNGAILVSWGETERRFLLHSARKSLDNIMYGFAIDEELVDLNSTLEDLNITEQTPLTTQEKSAKVIDLIQSRSGIYFPAAYDINKNSPKRGSAKPGQKWHYNNWDFNVNETIIEQQTGVPIEEYFNEKIAKPLDLQDFRLMDVYDHKEAISQHPAHPFRMSAQDLGRIGLLYLNKGKWKNNQLISSNWIEESTRAHSKLEKGAVGNGSDYGYLWWISDDRFKSLEMYYASGLNGQRLRIIPTADLVVVNLVNTYKRHNFAENDQLQLLDKILAARTSEPKSKPDLEKMEPSVSTSTEFDSIAVHFLGTYEAPCNFDPEVEKMKMTIQYQDDDLIANIEYGGTYNMIKVSENSYIMEDMDCIEEMRFPMVFFITEDGTAAVKLELAFVLDKVIFRKIQKQVTMTKIRLRTEPLKKGALNSNFNASHT